MATVNEKMTALADEIRELSGTTTTKSIDAMTSDVDVVNAEIAEQAELLEQIAAALEGKAGGGSGAIDTCTFSIVEDGPMDTWSGELIHINGSGVPVVYRGDAPFTVLKNSIVVAYGGSALHGNVETLRNTFNGCIVYYVTGDFYAYADM